MSNLYNLGVIPAAGSATRFGGILKELLPLPNGNSLLREAINRLDMFCDATVIVTTPEKIQAHAKEAGIRAIYAIQEGDNDIWSAIRTAISIPADTYLFTMPDTYLDRHTFVSYKGGEFGMGLFVTDKPERFGCLVDGKVVNKAKNVLTPAHAWGVLAWTSLVADMWREGIYADYTDAINAAIEEFGAETWKIGLYYDNASLADYGEIWTA